MSHTLYGRRLPHLVSVEEVGGRPALLSLGIQCPGCSTEGGGPTEVIADRDGLRGWILGDRFVQDALPDMSDDDRERLQTGICPRHWDEMFDGTLEETLG